MRFTGTVCLQRLMIYKKFHGKRQSLYKKTKTNALGKAWFECHIHHALSFLFNASVMVSIYILVLSDMPKYLEWVGVKLPGFGYSSF